MAFPNGLRIIYPSSLLCFTLLHSYTLCPILLKTHPFFPFSLNSTYHPPLYSSFSLSLSLPPTMVPCKFPGFCVTLSYALQPKDSELRFHKQERTCVSICWSWLPHATYYLELCRKVLVNCRESFKILKSLSQFHWSALVFVWDTWRTEWKYQLSDWDRFSHSYT